ncbi:hypothetical protein AB0323_10575 [Arthrobacter sp. NPDC080031]|uniref:hypothetical protein n=1 Tax=Arthrobacter sp. NPDC080031 TaxID=3155918 RepID=UPI00344BAABE
MQDGLSRCSPPRLFAAGGVFPVAKVIDVAEKPMQFRLGERALLGQDGIISGVPWHVPLEADLARDIAESLFAELAPPIARVRQVGAEDCHGLALRAQRLQADRFLARTQVGQGVINVDRAPIATEIYP